MFDCFIIEFFAHLSFIVRASWRLFLVILAFDKSGMILIEIISSFSFRIKRVIWIWFLRFFIALIIHIWFLRIFVTLIMKGRLGWWMYRQPCVYTRLPKSCVGTPWSAYTFRTLLSKILSSNRSGFSSLQRIFCGGQS